MKRKLSDRDLLTELEPAAEENLNRHLAMAVEWHPHDYVPWDQGRNFAAMGGADWDPEQSQLSEVAKAAMITNLLTEDNLPSYHHQAAEYFSLDGPWGTWVGRWTAEEARHSIVIRDYLVVTRGVDPVALEQARMIHMTNGFRATPEEEARHKTDFLLSVAYVSFQELATRVSHRNTGKVCNDPIADRMLARVAADENLHMIFYRNMCGEALDLVPDQASISRKSCCPYCANGRSSNATTSPTSVSSAASNSRPILQVWKARLPSSKNNAIGCWPGKHCGRTAFSRRSCHSVGDRVDYFTETENPSITFSTSGATAAA
jgi:hypothetical protein